MSSRSRLWQRIALSGMLTGTLMTGTLAIASPARADVAGTGNYANSLIATTALNYAGQWGGEACRAAGKLDNQNTGTTVGGYGAGQCRTFVNCIVYLASQGAQYPVGGDYFQSFLNVGGAEITNADNLVAGDIVQKYVSSSSLHTVIIVRRVSGSTFDVVDSNYSFNETVQEHNYTITLSSTMRAFRMAKPALTDGTWLADPAGRVYRMAGGAPIGLYNWGVLPGFDSSAVTHVDYTDLNNLAATPSNGTFISIYEAGGNGIYEFVGGAPLRQFNWGAIPGFDGGKVVTVNFESLVYMDHMRTVPADGSFVSIVEAGGNGIYTFAGGAPLRLYNWGAVPGFDGGKVTGINYQTLVNLDHMNAVPSDGAWLASAETGIVYRVAGGAALRLYNWGAIPGFDGGKVAWVNQQTLDTNDHMNAVPSDGTVLQGLPSGSYWQIASGHRTAVSAQTDAVQVDDQTVNAFLLS